MSVTGLDFCRYDWPRSGALGSSGILYRRLLTDDMWELWDQAGERAGFTAAGGPAGDELRLHAVCAAARHDRGRAGWVRPVRDAPEPYTATAGCAGQPV